MEMKLTDQFSFLVFEFTVTQKREKTSEETSPYDGGEEGGNETLPSRPITGSEGSMQKQKKN